MAKGKDVLVDLVTPVLQPGEELIATIKVQYNGSVQSNVLSINTGVNAIDDDHQPVPLDPDAAWFFPTANQMALALTGGRIFAWSLGITGKPKQFVGEVPLAAIFSLEQDPRHSAMVRVHMKSQTIVDLEYMRGEPQEAYEAFTAELQTLLGQEPAPALDPAAQAGSDPDPGPDPGPDPDPEPGPEPGPEA